MELKAEVETAILDLDAGRKRIAEKKDGGWVVNEWLKKAVLLSFRIRDNAPMGDGVNGFYDKVDTKFAGWDRAAFARAGLCAAPGAVVRKGAFVAPNVVLMPSFTNIGAFIDEGVMVDTWATVGSCAQIGKNVHLAGGVGIGGVLEPLQASPTIIEDNCFIGARSRDRRGRRRRGRQRHLHGRLYRPVHEDLRPRNGRDQLRARAQGLSRRVGRPARGRRLALPLLRGHRQEGRREDLGEGRRERAAQKRVSPAPDPGRCGAVSILNFPLDRLN